MAEKPGVEGTPVATLRMKRVVSTVTLAVATDRRLPAVVGGWSFPILPLGAPAAGSEAPESNAIARIRRGTFMRFTLLDRVVAIEPGKNITAVKNVTLAEEYLADHFPRFPVLPGVLMLEAMTQASAWTIRLGEDFAHSIVVLRAARNVKYGDFAEPGKTLTVTAEVLSQDDRITKVKASGKIGDRTSLTARLELERYNLADRVAHGAALDARVRAEMRRLWSLLYPAPRGDARSRPVTYASSLPGAARPAAAEAAAAG